MIRVLIVDDSPTVRSLLRAILSSDPELQIVGEAHNGQEAVTLARQLRPDVITMDIRMPKMDGFEATKEIMIESPTPIVIVTASRAIHDIEASMQALRAGALAILEKPAGPLGADFDETARAVIAHVKAMSQVKVVRHWRPVDAIARPRAPVAVNGARTRVVGIASSTGGPAALYTLLTALPADFPVPVLVVQHISPGFVHGLADWLNKAGPLHVKVAEEGEPLKRRTVYLAPDDRHLGASVHGTIALSSSPPTGGFRPSGTHLFESLVKTYGSGTTALILTGMGEDGVAGLPAVRQVGGRVIAQNEESCVVYGMPGAAVAANLVDEILPIEAMAARLVELAA